MEAIQRCTALSMAGTATTTVDVDPQLSLTRTSKNNQRIFHPDATIVLVGCHCAGKRTLGFLAAKYLGRRLLTEDHYYEQITGCTRVKGLRNYGKEFFSQKAALVLTTVLDLNPKNCIIEFGTGTFSRDTEQALQKAAETYPVVYIHREKEVMHKLLGLPTSDAEHLLLADQKHRELSNFEYFNLLDAGVEEHQIASNSAYRSTLMSSARLIHARKDFLGFLDLILGRGLTRSWMENPFSIGAIPPEYRTLTFALQLRLSTLLNSTVDLTDLEASGEAVELVIDTWPNNVLDIVATQVALIRRKLDLPIMYRVEENPREERRRAQEEKDAMDLELMIQGLRLGVEYLCVDLDRNQKIVSYVISMRGKTKIIGDFVVRGFGVPQWGDDSYVERFVRGRNLGCHMVRIGRFSMNDRSDEQRQIFLDKIAALSEPKPHIIPYDFSVFGACSPNITLNPVIHESLEASPREWLAGLNTQRGILRICFRKGELSPLKFWVLGSNVYYSVSPSMHRAGYEHYMMSHSYEARQCNSVEQVDKLRTEPDFGGANLTAPFKVVLMSKIDNLSAHAKAIGAINILLPLRGSTSSIIDHANARNTSGATNKFYGDNTDWSSITTCLRRAISPRNTVQPSRTTGLVIGAGGMARAAVYALIKIGCRNIFILNRTRTKAEEVALHFNEYAREAKLLGRHQGREKICHVIESAKSEWPAGYQQPSMILCCIPAHGLDGRPAVDFQLPTQWLRSPTGGVVVELAYEPLITPLVTQIRRIREEGNRSWVIVDGLEVVCEMAMEAFELQTGRKAPKRLMTQVCNETWERQFAPFQPLR